MSRIRGANLVTTIAALALLLPAAADARTINDAHQITAWVTARADRHIGFIPVNVMGTLPRFTVCAGHYCSRGPWVNATISGHQMNESLKYMRKPSLDGALHGLFSDRYLTKSERRFFVEMADFGRDADVLVVKQGHPACAGLTLTQVRSIVAGKTTKWSQVAAPASGASDTIRLIHTRFSDKFIEPRFGADMGKYAGKPASDGGLQAAASDGSVAAVTSWSRARYRGDVCKVPINGVEPTNASVYDLKFPGAYPIGFVTRKKTLRDRYRGTLLRRYIKFLTSERVKKLMRGTGLLVKGDKLDATPAPGGGGPVTGGPSQDSQGRPITPTRDDAAVTSTLGGERFEPEGATTRWVFEPDGIFRLLDHPTPDSCAAESGSWSVIEGWRFPENGGGLIARVQIQFDTGPRDVTVEIDNATPDIAYVDGQQYARSRNLSGTC